MDDVLEYMTSKQGGRRLKARLIHEKGGLEDSRVPSWSIPGKKKKKVDELSLVEMVSSNSLDTFWGPISTSNSTLAPSTVKYMRKHRTLWTIYYIFKNGLGTV